MSDNYSAALIVTSIAWFLSLWAISANYYYSIRSVAEACGVSG